MAECCAILHTEWERGSFASGLTAGSYACLLRFHERLRAIGQGGTAATKESTCERAVVRGPDCGKLLALTMPLAPGVRLGPYEVVAPIGAGGMGEVYRARDTRLNRDIAVKVLPEAVATNPDRLARFEREARKRRRRSRIPTSSVSTTSTPRTA
jgi:serine/threonine protein kinase